MPLGQASGFSRADPGGRVTPRFRHRLIRFRHFIDGSLALASLNLACRDHVPTFPQRSLPSLLTTAARGGLRPAPDCRPRRALLHLSYSSAPLHADGAFVTHDPKRTCHFRRSSKAAPGSHARKAARGRAKSGRGKPEMTLGLPTYVGDDIGALREAARANLAIFTTLPFFQRLMRASGFADEAHQAEQGAAGASLSDRLLDAICLIGPAARCRE